MLLVFLGLGMSVGLVQGLDRLLHDRLHLLAAVQNVPVVIKFAVRYK